MSDDRLRRIGRALGGLIPGVALARRLERLQHGGRAVYLGNNRVLVKIVVGGRDHAFYVEADDKLITPWFIVSGKYEVETTRFLQRTLRPDDHCVDVGANFGYYTVVMAKLCPRGRVVGVEAEARLAALARDNVRINDLDRVASVRHAAANDSGAPVALFRRTFRPGNTSITPVDIGFTNAMDEPPVERFEAPGLRVDDLLDDFGGRVDLLKIDVEGAEALALRGARETIARNSRLRIVMEWSPGQLRAAGFAPAEVAAEIAAAGLRAFRLTRSRIVALSGAELAALPYQGSIVLRR